VQAQTTAIQLLSDFPVGFGQLEDQLRILLSADERSAEDKLTDTVTVIKALLAGSAELGEKSRTPQGLTAVSAEHDVVAGYLADRVAAQMTVHKHLLALHWSNAATRAAHEAFQKINSRNIKHVACVVLAVIRQRPVRIRWRRLVFNVWARALATNPR
jgi:hypothetical protein